MPTGSPSAEVASGSEIGRVAGRVLQRRERDPVDQPLDHRLVGLGRVEVAQRAA